MDVHQVASEAAIENAVRLLREGGVVAFPTDTLYGLGVDALNKEAVLKLLRIKERPSELGLPLLLADISELEDWTKDIPPAAWRLARAFWPGPLTLVLSRSPRIADVVTGGRETVAVRVPNHPIPRALAAGLGRPLIGTSANKHGAIVPRTAAEVRVQLGPEVDLVIDGGALTSETPSTIVAFEGDAPIILRQGPLLEGAIIHAAQHEGGKVRRQVGRHKRLSSNARVDAATVLRRYEQPLEAEIRSLFQGRRGPLYDMMRYHLGLDSEGSSAMRGKRLRPSLVLVSCKAVGGDWRRALPGAAAIELLHNFSLIHDDIQDESPTRRGQPTLWWKWGIAQAINAGDGMHSLARIALLRLEENGYPASTIAACGSLLDETCLALCEGQYLDIHFQGLERVGTADYLDMISQKTGALFGASLQLGATLGGADSNTIERSARAGRYLGLAYQIRDDVLDLWGGEKTGKTHASDLLNKKKTFPVAHGLEAEGRPEGERIREIYQQPVLSAEDVREIVRLLEKLDTVGYCAQEERRYYALALAELDAVWQAVDSLEEVKALAAFLLERDH